MQKHNSQDSLEMKTGAVRESHDLLRAHCEATGTDTRGAWEIGHRPMAENGGTRNQNTQGDN